MLRTFILSIILLFGIQLSFGQILDGTILDKESQQPVPGVNIYNTHLGVSTISDENGVFSIQIRTGDTLFFRHLAFQTIIYKSPYVLGKAYQTIIMTSKAVKLKDATIIGKTRFQEDSEKREQVFHHDLVKEPVPTPKFNGLGASGIFGWMADKITGNSKKLKEFQKTFKNDDKSRFIETKYNADVVSKLTGMKDADSLARFINYYPMDYDFARSATELELKSWIKLNFKQYMINRKKEESHK